MFSQKPIARPEPEETGQELVETFVAQTTLFEAVDAMDPKKTRILLEEKRAGYATSSHGENALYRATQNVILSLGGQCKPIFELLVLDNAIAPMLWEKFSSTDDKSPVDLVIAWDRLDLFQSMMALYERTTKDSPEERKNLYNSLLIKSIKDGSGYNCQITEWLLTEKNASPNAKNSEGSTCLHLCICRDSCMGLLKLLLEKGADPQAQDKHGMIAVRLAAREKHFNQVNVILEKIGHIAPQDTHQYGGVFIRAVTAGRRDIAEMLLKQNVPVDKCIIDEHEDQCLHAAVRNQDEAMLRLLMKYKNKIDFSSRNKKKLTAHQLAFNLGYFDLLQIIVENIEPKQITHDWFKKVFFYAIVKGHADLVRLLLEKKVTPFIGATQNEWYYYEEQYPGETCLKAAIRSGNSDIILLMLIAGCNPDLKDDYAPYLTPRQFATTGAGGKSFASFQKAWLEYSMIKKAEPEDKAVIRNTVAFLGAFAVMEKQKKAEEKKPQSPGLLSSISHIFHKPEPEPPKEDKSNGLVAKLESILAKPGHTASEIQEAVQTYRDSVNPETAGMLEQSGLVEKPSVPDVPPHVMALKLHDFDSLELILGRNKTILENQYWCERALYHAAKAGHFGVVTFLMNNGISPAFKHKNKMVDKCITQGKTCLDAAVLGRNSEIIFLMLMAGCNPDNKLPDLKSSRELAAESPETLHSFQNAYMQYNIQKTGSEHKDVMRAAHSFLTSLERMASRQPQPQPGLFHRLTQTNPREKLVKKLRETLSTPACTAHAINQIVSQYQNRVDEETLRLLEQSDLVKKKPALQAPEQAQPVVYHHVSKTGSIN